MAKAEVAPVQGEVQVVAFKLRDEEYGFDILNVKEIKGLTDITRVPFALDYIKGVINLRGSVLPVIDLKKRLGLQNTEYTADTLDAEHIDASKVVDNESNRFIRGIGKENDRLIIMLNLEEIIGLQDEAK